MSWDALIRKLDEPGIVEFGIHQMNEKAGSKKWRRHKGGTSFRFRSIRSALFADKGARAACLGHSTYASKRYSLDDTSVVPYVATWLRGSDLAFLTRAGATEPEITLVPVHLLESLDNAEHAQLLAVLAQLFGDGARVHGVRHLVRGEIGVP